MAMITSAKLDQWPSDYSITKPKEAGLNHACYVRWKVFTLPNTMIVKIVGELGADDREALMAKTRTIFVRA